jgi:hypothetical protein
MLIFNALPSAEQDIEGFLVNFSLGRQISDDIGPTPQ